MTTPVGWAGLAVSLLLVAVAAGISWWQRLGLQRQILIAAARALAQLLLVGAALTPQIETTKATGLVFLPGAMTGLILAGAAPLQAVLVQAVVMFLVLAATATTTTVIALGLIRRLFTPDHRLVYLPAPADH